MTAKTIYSKISALRTQPEMAQPVRTPAPSPLAVLAEAGIHLLLAAVLAGAVVFGERAPLGVAFVAAAGSGLFGASALVGACFGSLAVLEFSDGLRYAAAAILAFAVHFAFYDWKVLRRPWAMPLVTGVVSAVTGFIVQAQSGWRAEDGFHFFLEVLLTVGATWAFRGALAPMGRHRADKPDPAARRVGPLNFEGLKRLGVVLKRAQYFLTCSGKMMRGLRVSEDGLLRHLISLEAPALAGPAPEQLSLFDSPGG